MNWIAKLTIIISTAIIAVVGILFYFRTKVSPPLQIKFTNQHFASLQSDVEMMKRGLDINTADSIFKTTFSAIGIFQKESFIDTIKSEQITQQMASRYVPLFVADYKNYFSKSEWSNRHNNEIRQKATMLLELKKQTDGEPILTNSLKQQVDSAITILQQYDEATDLYRNACYINILESERTINQANQYATSFPLCNCSSLVAQLKDINKKLENSHFHELEKMVKDLEMYPYYSQEFFQDNLVPNVNEALKEYKENALRIYGTNRSTLSLEYRVKEICNKASDYYDEE